MWPVRWRGLLLFVLCCKFLLRLVAKIIVSFENAAINARLTEFNMQPPATSFIFRLDERDWSIVASPRVQENDRTEE